MSFVQIRSPRPFFLYRYRKALFPKRAMGINTLADPCQLAMENGARRALIPIENRRQFLEVSGHVAERLDQILYGEPQLAASKALGVT